jgi:hypothetical protein
MRGHADGPCVFRLSGSFFLGGLTYAARNFSTCSECTAICCALSNVRAAYSALTDQQNI